MDYATFVKTLEDLRPQVHEWVVSWEYAFSHGATPETLDISFLKLPPIIALALKQNAFKLMGVKRIMGSPYATHPTQMALMALKILGDDPSAITTAVCSVFHDYLEEGDGRNREGVNRFLNEFPNHDLAVVSAIVLSEPQIPYGNLFGERKDLEDVAYIVQLTRIRESEHYRALVNASLLDKLDNLHNLEYITLKGRHEPRVRSYKLVKKLACFRFVLNHLEKDASTGVVSLLAEGLESLAAEHHVPSLALELATEHLQECLVVQRRKLEEMIDHYQDAVWPHFSTALK